MKNPDELLKAATQQHDTGDLDSAITTLREALKALSKTDTSYSVSTFTRLPLYLQKAGRFEEAKKEFEILLKSSPEQVELEFAHQTPVIIQSLVAMRYSEIYDKIRVAYEREKLFADAAAYNILSMANQCLGLHLQGRKEELEGIQQEDFWHNWTAKTLKKAGLLDKQAIIIKECLEAIQNPSGEKVKNLHQYLSETLAISKNLL